MEIIKHGSVDIMFSSCGEYCSIEINNFEVKDGIASDLRDAILIRAAKELYSQMSWPAKLKFLFPLC